MEESRQGNYATNTCAPTYSIAVPVHLLKDRDVSATAKLLYGVIDSFQKRSGICFASNERLADEVAGCSPRTISRCITELKEAGYIIVEDNDGRKIRLSVSFREGQRGGQKCLPPSTKVSTPYDKIGEGVGQNCLQSILDSSNIIPPKSPQGAGAAGRKKRSKDYKSQADTLPERFEGFWTFYRTHMPPDRNAGNRQQAIRAWDKLAPSDALATTMAISLARQVKSRAWAAGVGVPHASTWLNNHGWEDDWGSSVSEGASTPEMQNGEEAAEWVN